MNFFNIGFLELLVILTLALIIFGPQRLLLLGQALRKAFTEFQRNATEFASSALEQANTYRSTPDDGQPTEFVDESVEDEDAEVEEESTPSSQKPFIPE